MSDSSAFGFGKFVPGFDFLQNLAQSAVKGATQGMPQMPNLSSWVAPTLNVEELDRRIQELKAVQFWLDQNARALTATIQALEVQKMTLDTLKGMNVKMTDVAQAFQFKAPSAAPEPAAPPAPAASPASPFGASPFRTPEPEPAPQAAPEPAPQPEPAAQAEGAAESASPAVDPVKWWGSLTQQFQQIAANAMQDVARQAAAVQEEAQAAAARAAAPAAARKSSAAGKAKAAAKPAPKTTSKAPPARAAAGKAPAKAASKSAPRTAARKPRG